MNKGPEAGVSSEVTEALKWMRTGFEYSIIACLPDC